MPQNSDLQVISPRQIAGDVSLAAVRLMRTVRTLHRVAEPAVRARLIAEIERDLDVALYWSAVLIADSDQSGFLLSRALHATHELLDLTLQAVRVWRYREAAETEPSADAAFDF